MNNEETWLGGDGEGRRKPKEIRVGDTFGAWEVLGRGEKRRPEGGTFWKCRCTNPGCNTVTDVLATNLRTGKSKQCLSCGARAACKKRYGDGMRSWPNTEHIPGWYWSSASYNAAVRKIPVTATQDDADRQFASQRGICTLSGLPLVFVSEVNRRADTTASLDRVDNDDPRGYHPDNIQWIHKDVNELKGVFDQQELVYWCHLITAHKSGLTPDQLATAITEYKQSDHASRVHHHQQPQPAPPAAPDPVGHCESTPVCAV